MATTSHFTRLSSTRLKIKSGYISIKAKVPESTLKCRYRLRPLPTLVDPYSDCNSHILSFVIFRAGTFRQLQFKGQEKLKEGGISLKIQLILLGFERMFLQLKERLYFILLSDQSAFRGEVGDKEAKHFLNKKKKKSDRG